MHQENCTWKELLHPLIRSHAAIDVAILLGVVCSADISAARCAMLFSSLKGGIKGLKPRLLFASIWCCCRFKTLLAANCSLKGRRRNSSLKVRRRRTHGLMESIWAPISMIHGMILISIRPYLHDLDARWLILWNIDIHTYTKEMYMSPSVSTFHQEIYSWYDCFIEEKQPQGGSRVRRRTHGLMGSICEVRAKHEARWLILCNIDIHTYTKEMYMSPSVSTFHKEIYSWYASLKKNNLKVALDSEAWAVSEATASCEWSRRSKLAKHVHCTITYCIFTWFVGGGKHFGSPTCVYLYITVKENIL